MVVFYFGGPTGGISNYVNEIVTNSNLNYKIICKKEELSKFSKVFDANALLAANFNTISVKNILKNYEVLFKDLNNSKITFNAHALKKGLIGCFYKILFFKKIKFVYTDHGSPYKQKKNIIKSCFFWLIEFAIILIADDTIHIRNSENQYWGKFKILKNKQHYIKTQMVSEQLFSSKKQSSSSFNIAMIGKAYDLKDPNLFFEIANSKFKTDSKLNFYWIGDVSLLKKSEIKNQLQVKFIGEIDYSKMHKIWSFIDILLVTSRVEIVPLIILEAMRSSTLVISRDYEGYNELIKNFDTGLIYKSKDEAVDVIDNITSDSVLRNQIISNAKNYFLKERNNINEFANAYLSVLKT